MIATLLAAILLTEDEHIVMEMFGVNLYFSSHNTGTQKVE